MAIGFLIPMVIWVLGMPFEGRYDGRPHAALVTALAPWHDRALVAYLAADVAYGSWFVWTATGLRWRILIVAAFQFACCVFVVYADLLWSGGPP